FAAFGIDRSPQMGRQARRRLESCQLSPSLTRSLAQRIPFPGRVFDQVVATFPTEYIVHPDTLAEIFRVLRPGGSLIILPAATITQPKSGRERFGAWLFRATGQIVKKDKRFQVQMEDPIRQAGFQIETRQRPFKSSTIFIILAQKPSITHLTT
ncbi:MAG: class I SAM-dependent methyltransferase, partial [Anaerolineales bacterium]